MFFKSLKPVLATAVLGLLPYLASAENLPAFPGAEGFARYVTGGRGGAVYHVTTLKDTTTVGTLRWALSKSGTKTIVFDVSGTIHLKSAMQVSKDNCTIAGQTAPGDGICIADYPFTIKANNVIIRFLRFRLGDKNGQESDGLGAMDKNNIIVDHCSVSWSVDECCSIYGGKNLTVQWCLISQSLDHSAHSKGSHGYGGNWGGSGCTYHHNLLCHHKSRTPRLGPRSGTQTDERLDLRNNVIYNWAGNGCYGGEGMNVNIVNNYYKLGPGTKKCKTTIQQRIASPGIRTTEYCKRVVNSDGSVSGNSWLPMWHVWGKFYVNGNVNTDHPEVTKDNWTYGVYNQIDENSYDGTYTQGTRDTMKIDSPIPFYYVTTHTAEDAYERVLAYAGASLSRDSYDAIMVSDTRKAEATYNGKNGSTVLGIIDSQDDLKPADADDTWTAWPTLDSKDCPVDTDQDGMPDAWETANGLNPNNASDRNNKNAEGYTMLEVYINSLVQDITNGELEGGKGEGIKLGEETTSIFQSPALNAEFADVYNIKGVLVKKNFDRKNINSLPKGLYIVDGEKMLIRE